MTDASDALDAAAGEITLVPRQAEAGERVQAAPYTLRLEFWQKTLDALEVTGVDLYQNVSREKTTG